MAYHPNIAAVQYFAAEIWPLIRENEPGIVWELIGKNPESLRLPPDPRIRIVGPVEDAVAAMAGARVAVVPILSGSGTRFKILEAWAAGIPVVSTTLGAEGLEATHGEHLLIADDPVSFADAVKVLLKDEAMAHRIGHSGRQLYESAYTWPVAWKILQAAGL
jgi:glycosyltransferase involved in cell wall biosynthesis